MSDHVYLNADKTALVDQFSIQKKYQLSLEEAARLGFVKEKQERRVDPAPPADAPKQKRRYTKRKP